MVNLKTLELQQTTPESIPLYEALSFKQPDQAILPQLKTLQLWISTDSVTDKDKELHPLLDMLSSRCSEGTVPVGFEPLKHFIVGVASEDIHDLMRELFDPWIGGLPSRLQFEINVDRPYHSQQPDGWTHPISDW
jgi:hypothetical protein